MPVLLAVHNVAGMLQAREMGFKRVIAAREICAREAAAMAAVPDIELEVFVHGALRYATAGFACCHSACAVRAETAENVPIFAETASESKKTGGVSRKTVR